MEAKMKGEENSGAVIGHVLVFPCPAQGHVTSMLKLAELLALSELRVTFLNTEYVHKRLMRFGHIDTLLPCYPTIQFKTFSDCFTEVVEEEEHPGIGDRIGDVINSINLHAKPLLRDILVNEKVTCLIADGIFGSLTNVLARQLGITLIHFRTASACSVWSYLCFPKLLECNELPIRGDEDMDRIISNTPGMENLLRCRDLPSVFRPNRKGNLMSIDSVVFETQQSVEADAFILNTFEDLESPVLSQMRLHFPKLFTIGPLHQHLNLRKSRAREASLTNNDGNSLKGSLFQVDRSCMVWLDAQPERSVIYVSFGSVAVITREELIEIWHGLVNSKKRFLWVMRPHMITEKVGEEQVPMELEEGTKEHGFMVEWAPQDEVLRHKAIGGFLTHSGWNSTLESIVAGIPMICWPYFADQQINSRFVSEVWKLGLDMKDVCDRNIVENIVNDLMLHRKEEFLKSAQKMASLAHKSVIEGGSSYSNLDHLIHYIKSTTLKCST